MYALSSLAAPNSIPSFISTMMDITQEIKHHTQNDKVVYNPYADHLIFGYCLKQ